MNTDPRPGDVIELFGEVVSSASYRVDQDIEWKVALSVDRGPTPFAFVAMTPLQLMQAKTIRRGPIKAGDPVRWRCKGFVGVVLAVDGGSAWCKWHTMPSHPTVEGAYSTCEAHELELETTETSTCNTTR